MRQVRGKKREFRLHQFANDWISADDMDGRPCILRPTQVELTDEEFRSMDRDPNHVGTFWKEWQPYFHQSGYWRFRPNKGA